MKLIHPITGLPRVVPDRPLPARLTRPSQPIQAVAPARLPVGLSRIIRPDAQTRWLLPSVANVTPSYIESVLRGAIAGNHVQQWELFDLMEDTWPRLVKNLNDVKRSVTKLNWRLEVWAEEDEAATDSAVERSRLVSSAVWQMRPAPGSAENAFEGTLYDILDAWAKGVAVVEIDWEKRNAGRLGDIIAPKSTIWVHPRNYAWSTEGWLGLAVMSGVDLLSPRGGTQVEPFPEDKFLVSVCKSRSGHPLAGALLRPLAWWWCAANFSQEWFLNFAQLFGVPIRWANYDPNTPGLIERVADMLENMGSSAWGAFPAGTTLELKEPMKAGTDNPQVALLDRSDKQCDLLILGQTLTSDVGDSGSRALGDVHQAVRADVIASAADFAAGIVNQQLVPAILRLNYGDDLEAPYFIPEPRKVEDTKSNAERDQMLLAQGVEMPRAWFYERHGIPLPQEGEETITGRDTTAVLPAGPNGIQPATGTPAIRDTSDVQATALNGAQVQALADLAEKVASGQLPYETGLSIARAAFPLVPDEVIVRIFSALRRFKPAPPPGSTNDEADAAVRAEDATDKVVDAALEDLTGVEARWLGGVKPIFRELIAAAKNEAVSDDEFVRALDRARRQMPELFTRLQPRALEEALFRAMSAATVNGAVKGAMKRRAAR